MTNQGSRGTHRSQLKGKLLIFINVAYKLFCLQRAEMFPPLPIVKKTCKIEVPKEKPIFIPQSGSFYHLPYSLT